MWLSELRTRTEAKFNRIHKRCKLYIQLGRKKSLKELYAILSLLDFRKKQMLLCAELAAS